MYLRCLYALLFLGPMIQFQQLEHQTTELKFTGTYNEFAGYVRYRNSLQVSVNFFFGE